ncbi:MAG TPA: Hsp20/alpha crystallin family protein [Candidatus Sulfotelmatobacter sp.]|nr:Hsp20/alpha crystallin family protein [Candidatus Sulfotelmatobacter sp.]
MNLHSEMDRVFNELFPAPDAGRARDGRTTALPIDIHSNEKELIVEASVPGYEPDEVNVTFDNGVLTIEAERKKEARQEERNWVRQERFVGRLYRQVQLGEGVNFDQAQATFKNGVLTITAPLAARPEAKRIPVKAESK